MSLASRVTLPAFLVMSLARVTTSWQACGAFAGITMLCSLVTALSIWCGDFQQSRCTLATVLAHTRASCLGAGGGRATAAP